MKLLLVDDNPRRYNRLIEALVRTHLARSDIDIASCAMDARSRLADTKYDLLVIDIILPLRADEAPSESHSRELLEEICESDTLIRPGQIVGLSADANAIAKLSDFFRERLWSAIAYSEVSDEWMTQIANCVDYLKGASDPEDSADFDFDIAILCALHEPELREVIRLPWAWEPARPIDSQTFVHEGVATTKNGKFRVVAAAAGRMGMTASALMAAKMISKFRPRILVMTGICGGIRGKAQIGDVVLADPCWDWQSGKRVKEGGKSVLKMTPHQVPCPPEIRTAFEQMRADKDALAKLANTRDDRPPNQPRILVEPMATGSAVLADALFTDALREQHKDLCAVEMEAYGVCYAGSVANKPRPATFALKAVCDLADEEKNDLHQNFAAYMSARVLAAFVDQFGATVIRG